MSNKTTPLTRVVHVKYDRFDVYVGRKMPNHENITGMTDGMFGNPIRWALDDYTQKFWLRYIDALFERLHTDRKFLAAVKALKGKRIACWCKADLLMEVHRQSVPCHADILAFVADNL